MRYDNWKILLIFALFLSRIAPASRFSSTQTTLPMTQQGQDHANKEEGKEKDAMQLLQALAQAAQAAAMAAAMAANKKGGEKTQQSEPVKVPEIPNMSVPPQAPEKQEELKLPEQAASSPAPEIELKEEPPATVASNFEFPSPSPSTSADFAPSGPATETVESTIPERMPDGREKLGYDETNPTGGTPSPAGAGGVTNVATAGASLSSSAAARGATSELKLNDLNPEGKEAKERFAKNVTAPEEGGAAGESAGYGSGSGGVEENKTDTGNMMDMISQMMGGQPQGETLASAPHAQGENIQNGTRGSGARIASSEKENIFEYASYRFRKLAFEDKSIKRDARKKPALAGVLNQAHDIFTSAAH